MKTATAWTTESHSQAITAACQQLIDELGKKPDFIMLQCSASDDTQNIVSQLHIKFPYTPLHGGTSCLGVMTEAGFHSKSGEGLGLFAITDPDGLYGVGSAMIDSSPREAARSAIKQALDKAGCSGEVPAIVWITAAPGNEEELLLGIADVVGED